MKKLVRKLSKDRKSKEGDKKSSKTRDSPKLSRETSPKPSRGLRSPNALHSNRAKESQAHSKEYEVLTHRRPETGDLQAKLGGEMRVTVKDGDKHRGVQRPGQYEYYAVLQSLKHDDLDIEDDDHHVYDSLKPHGKDKGFQSFVTAERANREVPAESKFTWIENVSSSEYSSKGQETDGKSSIKFKQRDDNLDSDVNLSERYKVEKVYTEGVLKDVTGKPFKEIDKSLSFSNIPKPGYSASRLDDNQQKSEPLNLTDKCCSQYGEPVQEIDKVTVDLTHEDSILESEITDNTATIGHDNIMEGIECANYNEQKDYRENLTKQNEGIKKIVKDIHNIVPTTCKMPKTVGKDMSDTGTTEGCVVGDIGGSSLVVGGSQEETRSRRSEASSSTSGSWDLSNPEDTCTAPTQSITNGDRTDNSDDGSSVRGAYSTIRDRSRSRERAHEAERWERDGPRAGPSTARESEYSVIATQPRSSKGKQRSLPRRHTVGGANLASGTGRYDIEQETERSKEAFMDMLAARYPKYAEKISSTTSEDGFPVRGRSRDPRRRATVGYSQPHNRSMDYDGGTGSEVDAPAFHRGGFVRSSLPAARSPPSVDKPPGLVFLIFRDETKKALLPNEITHLDTVRAMFVRSFPGKLTMSYLDSPKRKIYILEASSNIYYQLEDLRDIKDRTVLRIHECDSKEPQRVTEKPEVRGRTVQIPASQGYYGPLPASAVTSQVHKAQTLPSYMHHPVYMSHDDISQSPSRTAYERSRSLTPEPMRTAGYAQNPIYGRMGISPERPPPPQDRTGVGPCPDRPPVLRPIPENYLMLNGYKNGSALGYDYADNGLIHRPYPRQAMSPPAVPSGPRVEPSRRAFSPPPNLQNYDYIQVLPSSDSVVPASQGFTGPTYIAQGVRSSTVVTSRSGASVPHTAQAPHGSETQTSVPPSSGQPQQPASTYQQTWRERSPVGRHSMALSTVAPYSPPTTVQQRSQSYRVPSTSERDPALMRPRSMTPSPMDNYDNDLTRNRIDKMEHQLANLAAWVQSAVVQSSGSSTGDPSTEGKSGPGTPSLGSEPSPQAPPSHVGLADGMLDVPVSVDMRMNILSIKHQADSLRSDLHSLRRLQQINKESILETVDDAWKKIKDALASVPGAEHLLVRQQRNEVDVMYKIYLEDKAQADKELGDLEHAVEELRSDVLSRQCRVQMSDVEGMALILSHVTKQLGDLKTRFPKLQDRLKQVMSAEMEIIVREEKWLKDEPERLDNSLKKCKKLTGTLFTLKRLASVQEHRPPQQVSLSAQARIPTLEDKKAVLENIQAMIPDHNARLQGIQAAETARMIKKKITTQQEALRFGKSLELASKALKPHGAASATSQGAITTAGPVISSPSRPAGDTSSLISFMMPMSTSTPKSAGQHTTSSKTESSATSPSIAYPVMSLAKHIGHSSESSTSSASQKGSREDRRAKVHDGKGQRPAPKNQHPREQHGEPAILPVTSSETSSETGRQTERKSDKPVTAQAVELSTQKSAARAAFFSSLSSPSTPTTCTSPIGSTGTTLCIDSPTDGSTKISPGAGMSPVRGIPTLVRSSAVSLPSSSVSTVVTQPFCRASSVGTSASMTSTTATKPSSLPVSTSSVVSSQRFSPASPSGTVQSTTSTSSSSSSRPRTTFTAIPKPYSPTRSTPSPLTPESPKYRIPPSQQSAIPMSVHPVDSGGRKSSGIPQSREPAVRPKKVPPPPPPRKSSKLPGHAVMAVNTATVNGQLPKPKHALDIEPRISKPSVTFESSSKQATDIIRPPKQFANIELEAKVERKSSIGSLKQFTTPLLESKRDRKDSKDQKPEMVGKKISSSNLDSHKIAKQIEKDIDISKESLGDETQIDTSSRKVIDGKVTNLSDDRTQYVKRELSVDSSSSSSSLDSQQEIWIKRKDEVSEASSSVTQSSEDTGIQSESLKDVSDQSASRDFSDQSEPSKSDQSVPSISQTQEDKPETVVKRKQKPAPPERRSSLSSKSKTEEMSDPVETSKGDDSHSKSESQGVIDRLV